MPKQNNILHIKFTVQEMLFPLQYIVFSYKRNQIAYTEFLKHCLLRNIFEFILMSHLTMCKQINKCTFKLIWFAMFLRKELLHNIPKICSFTFSACMQLFEPKLCNMH